jgi:hypothetical protein
VIQEMLKFEGEDFGLWYRQRIWKVTEWEEKEKNMLLKIKDKREKGAKL